MSLLYTREKNVSYHVSMYFTCGWYPDIRMLNQNFQLKGLSEIIFGSNQGAMSLQIYVADRIMRPPKMDLASPKTFNYTPEASKSVK